jgi:PKD repeat protein
MKKVFLKRFFASILVGVYLLVASNLLAQTNTLVSYTTEEKKSIKVLKKEGISDPEIERGIMKRRLMLQKEKATPAQPLARSGKPPVVYANSCGDMGGENGWSNWKGRTGDIDRNTGVVTWGTWSNPPPTTNANTGFTLTTGPALDGCTPSAGSPPLPIVSPGFGNFSILLGVPLKVGAYAEQLSFPLTVTAADTNFIYSYAIVLDNPADGNHIGIKAPHAEIYILDDKGDTVDCSHQLYFGSNDATLPPGFYQIECNNTFKNAYKPWTTVGVNLSKYLTKNITIVIGNYDCALKGHFVHSYWDFMCPPLASSVLPFCEGQSTTMTAPLSGIASNPYTYQWYQNNTTKPFDPKKHWTLIPGQTGSTYTTKPLVGDTFAVNIGQSGSLKCGFWIPFAPKVKKLTTDFTLTNNCGVVTFKDASPTPSTGTITNWNWNFLGGTPPLVNATTNQNQVVTYPTAGTHTATLDVISSEGCVATKTLVVTTGDPVAQFSTGPVCLGINTTFSDASFGVPGDPVTTWDWNFGDGGTSGLQLPSHIYASAGTYPVELNIKTQGGCTTTITHTVTVNPIPVPLFKPSNVCFNSAATVFNNSSTGATQYAWDFGDGSIDTQKDPTHKYGSVGTFTITLAVTNSFGCTDRYISTAVIHPLPVPNFSSAPVCIGDSTCFIDKSSIAAPCSVTGWNWNFGDPTSGINNTSNSENPCHIYTGLGPYNVLLTVLSDSGCTSNITIPAKTNPLPKAAIIPKNICIGANTTFIDASTALGVGNAISSWIWNFGDGNPLETVQHPAHIYASAGTFTVSLIISTLNGCKDTTTNTVVIYTPPVPNFVKPEKGCSPVFANYTDLSTSIDGKIGKWHWSFPGGSPTSSTSQNPSNIKYSTEGSYSVSLVVTTEFGCIDSIQLPMVDVYDWPTAEFSVTPTVASTTYPVFSFSDLWTSNVDTFKWNFGDSSPFDLVNKKLSHSYSASVTNNDFYSKQICVFVKTKHGCRDSICHKVEIIPEFTFYIPNTFTPNGDSINDMFFGKCRGVKEYDIWLFDRWGNQVWDCHKDDRNINWDSDLTNPRQDGLASYCKWDGKAVQGGLDMGGNSGQYVQEDVYVWKVRLLDIFNKRHAYVGHVNIVR